MKSQINGLQYTSDLFFMLNMMSCVVQVYLTVKLAVTVMWWMGGLRMECVETYL